LGVRAQRDAVCERLKGKYAMRGTMTALAIMHDFAEASRNYRKRWKRCHDARSD
jgi:hypothetical protein